MEIITLLSIILILNTISALDTDPAILLPTSSEIALSILSTAAPAWYILFFLFVTTSAFILMPSEIVMCHGNFRARLSSCAK